MMITFTKNELNCIVKNSEPEVNFFSGRRRFYSTKKLTITDCQIAFRSPPFHAKFEYALSTDYNPLILELLATKNPNIKKVYADMEHLFKPRVILFKKMRTESLIWLKLANDKFVTYIMPTSFLPSRIKLDGLEIRLVEMVLDAQNFCYSDSKITDDCFDVVEIFTKKLKEMDSERLMFLAEYIMKKTPK